MKQKRSLFNGFMNDSSLPPVQGLKNDSYNGVDELRYLDTGKLIELYAYADAIINTLREPLIILDKELKVIQVNKSYFDVFGVSKRETVGKKIFELGNGQWNKPLLKRLLMETVGKDSVFQNYEVDHVFEKIGRRIMILNGRRIILSNRKTDLILLVIEDVTERRRLRDALEAADKKARMMMESITDAFFALDKNWNFIYANRKAEDILGKHSLVGYNIWADFPELVRGGIYKKFIKVGKKNKPVEFEHYLESADKWLEIHIYPSIEGVSVYFQDISERKLSDKKKDEFLSIAGHELKTPITTLKAYTEILEKKLKQVDDVQNVSFVNNIRNQANKLTKLINDLLDVSRIQEGKMVFNLKQFDLDAMVEKVVDDIQVMTDSHLLIKEGNVKGVAWGDPDRLGQVVTNLINNAIRYSPKSDKVIVKTEMSGKNVVISVKDFGIGIAKNKYCKIFERFYRDRTGVQSDRAGFGLGLYIAAEIIRRHRGKIWVESEVGKGSTFFFRIPIKERRQRRPRALD